MSSERRDRLRDAAIEVLAAGGGRGLTHRAVDGAAGVPAGTAKNYYPSREALLRGVAERCVEQYAALTAATAAGRDSPLDREGLVALFGALVANVAGPGRTRLLAYLELQVEAARRPWLAEILDPIALSDFLGFAQAQRAAGLPVTPQRSAVLTLALHASIPHLLAGGRATLAAAGLDDPETFARGLLDVIYPQPGTPTARV